MTLRKFILFLSLFSAMHVFGDETYWDARLVRNYVHNSEMQRRWAGAFLAPYLRQLKGDEHILDIGCGDGKITADVAKFIPQGSILGIDPSKPMINWAKKQFCALEYPNLSFCEGGFMEPNLEGSFDVIISNCALQHCANQPQAFQNLAKLIKPGGKILIMVPAIDNAAWKQARKAVQLDPKWVSYWETVPPRKFLTTEEYTLLLKEANFYPNRIEKVPTRDPFVDRDEFLDFLLGTFTPAIPLAKAREFYNDMINEYLRLYPEALNADGVVEARYGRIEIEATKL